MSFIQVQQSLVSHRKTLRLARLLSLDRYAVVGRLVALWAWALDNALDGCLGDDIDAEVLADVMGYDASFGKPAELLEALLSAGFLELDESDQRLHIHDWHEHMGRLIEKREASAERMRRMRARNAAVATSSGSVSVDSADGDASDGERSQSDETHVTRTLRARYATRVEQSRVEQSITTGEDSSPERERATHDLRHDATTQAMMEADAALSHSAPASPVTSVTRPSPTTRATKAKAANVTPLRGARLPDPVWDACIAAMGSPPSNHVERGRWAKGIVGLKESLTAALPPGVTTITAEVAAEIGVRSRRYRARYGTGVPLNPMALAGNWTALASDITEEGKHHGHVISQRHYGQSAAAGRRGGRTDGRPARPAIGTAAYYAQAAATQGHAHGGGATDQSGRVAAVGEW